MRFFTVSVAGLALALTAFSSAVAAPPGDSSAPTAHARQVVMWCESGSISRRSYEREHGRSQVFVTADQVVAAQRAGEVWDAPRCMTSREYSRLNRTLATRKTGA